ncbi:MAG: DCC1-like thiol-disulfide oxidoreductase family protein [Planctomycetes bacterium]|nr:DCC1-like thiol-disulfide oxidoreductase family protein [Planctomycetota bacterium]
MYKTSVDHPIVFFDGNCALCNGMVDFIIARDAGGVFRFAALQGETARNLLGVGFGDAPASDANWMNSIVVVDSRGVHRKSDATIRILSNLPIFRWAALFLMMVPRLILDEGYDFIARNRYRWFGEKISCRVPSKDETARFLP